MFIINKILDLFFGRLPKIRQFFQYAIIGAFNTVLDFSAYYFLTRFLNWKDNYYLLANAISFILAVSSSFYLNGTWTFDSKLGFKKYFGFIGVNLLTLLLIEVLLYILVDKMLIFDLYAKILVVAISGISNFTMSKFFVFKNTLQK